MTGRSGIVWAGLVGFFLSSLLRAPTSGFAQGQTGLPPVEDVLKKAIERAQWVEAQKFEGKYTYTQHNTIDELNSKENVKKHEERLHHVFPIEGELYARLAQKDGKPLSEKEVKQEQERERKFRQRLPEKKWKRAEGKKDENEVNFDEELVSKYRFELVGREPVNGRSAFVLSFEPKRHDLAVRRRLDRLLNKLAGKLWIDEQDYEVSRADVHLTGNVSAWSGLVASVRKFSLQLEQTKVDEAAWFPSFADAYIDGRILIKSLHMKVKQQNSDFRRVAPEAGQPGSSKE